MKQGDRGTAVRRLQMYMRQMGLKNAVDGIYGPLTEQTLIRAMGSLGMADTETNRGKFFDKALSVVSEAAADADWKASLARRAGAPTPGGIEQARAARGATRNMNRSATNPVPRTSGASGPHSPLPVVSAKNGFSYDRAKLLALLAHDGGPRGYEALNGPASVQRTLTTMTNREVYEYARKVGKADGPKGWSGAAGRYQFTWPNLGHYLRTGVIQPNELFSAALQDDLAYYHAMKNASRQRTATGRHAALARQWAIVPGPDGQGRYDNDGINKAKKSLFNAAVEVTA